MKLDTQKTTLALVLVVLSLAILVGLSSRYLSLRDTSNTFSVNRPNEASDVAEPPYVKTTRWQDDPENPTGKSDAFIWRTYTSGDWKEFTMKLGDPDTDGEVRSLLVRNASGCVANIGPLPQNLSYVKTFSEFDGTPINHSPVELSQTGNSDLLIEVYQTTPISLSDYRHAIQVNGIGRLLHDPGEYTCGPTA